MTDEIKPDTSLYSDWPSKLRALALVLEADPERVQTPRRDGTWGPVLLPSAPRNRLMGLADGQEYRLAPVLPRTLHVDVLDGKVFHAYDGATLPPPPYPGATRVTYVLKTSD